MNIKVKRILLTLILVFLSLLFWRITLLLSNLSSLFSKTETVPEAITNNKIHNAHKVRPKNTAVDNSHSGIMSEQESPDESIEETIARLKRDVIVTGTITGIPGQESAMFQIEGMKDRLFNINTQLMDGFIIVEITHSTVVLRNQTGGHESFTLEVQSQKNRTPDSLQITENNDSTDDGITDTTPVAENSTEMNTDFSRPEKNPYSLTDLNK